MLLYCHCYYTSSVTTIDNFEMHLWNKLINTNKRKGEEIDSYLAYSCVFFFFHYCFCCYIFVQWHLDAYFNFDLVILYHRLFISPRTRIPPPPAGPAPEPPGNAYDFHIMRDLIGNISLYSVSEFSDVYLLVSLNRLLLCFYH